MAALIPRVPGCAMMRAPRYREAAQLQGRPPEAAEGLRNGAAGCRARGPGPMVIGSVKRVPRAGAGRESRLSGLTNTVRRLDAPHLHLPANPRGSGPRGNRRLRRPGRPAAGGRSPSPGKTPDSRATARLLGTHDARAVQGSARSAAAAAAWQRPHGCASRRTGGRLPPMEPRRCRRPASPDPAEPAGRRRPPPTQRRHRSSSPSSTRSRGC